MPFVQDLIARFRQTVTAYAGDDALMQAGVSAAANVIVADGEVAGAEFETALTGVLASPILEKGYDVLMLEEALYEAIGRARTRAGRADNLRRIAAIAGRPAEQRESVFLVAADVADHDGIVELEHAALAEIAAALLVDKAALLRTVPARTAGQRTTG
ncbi:tellurite resistance TerB family protein [Methylobacterium radiotolerans]|uniref:tellurite resistance TerB family protein n=1 Tax=Methylobacterium radiotolerans TaxID=31998 RepID=UPI001F3A6AA5|nr:tellurite resistance TerB family protein [Methylobacterium radiotolerans]UIY43522.1 tellurite resistance TerB family protein [Methylobacterium radiotolerans]